MFSLLAIPSTPWPQPRHIRLPCVISSPRVAGLISTPLASETIPTHSFQGTPGFRPPSFTSLFPSVSAPCPAPGPARRGGGASVAAAAAAAASASHSRCRCLRRSAWSNLQAQCSDFAKPGRSAETSLLLPGGPGRLGRRWGEPPLAGDREGGAWSRSPRHPSPGSTGQDRLRGVGERKGCYSSPREDEEALSQEALMH